MTGASTASAHPRSAERAAVVAAGVVWDLPIADSVPATTKASASIASTRTATVAQVTIARATAIADTPAVAHSAAITHTARVPITEVAGLLLPADVLPGVGLTILHRIASSRASIFIGELPVRIRRSSAVGWVVLPIAIAPGRLL